MRPNGNENFVAVNANKLFINGLWCSHLLQNKVGATIIQEKNF